MKSTIQEYFNPKTPSDKKDRLLSQIYQDKELLSEFAYIKNIDALILLQSSSSDEKDGEKAFKKFHKNILKNSYLKLVFRAASYAAIGLICIVIGILFNNIATKPTEGAFKIVQVPAGQRALVTLEDNTQIWLNSSSKLEYVSDVQNTERKVKLTGAGYFKVNPNKKKPFIVNTKSLHIKVTGTSFNISEYTTDEIAEVGLVEGSIDITLHNQKRQYSLVAGEKLSYADGVVSKGYINQEDYLWRNGIYYFNNIRFEDLCKKLELYYNVTLEIRNQNLKDRLYTGKFRQQDGIAEILRIIQKTFSFTVVKNNDSNHFLIQ